VPQQWAPPISKAFLKALAETFDEAGREAVKHVRDNDPEAYASVFASVIPKDATPSDIYSDAQMDRLRTARPQDRWTALGRFLFLGQT
jgi:hypothetical protein